MAHLTETGHAFVIDWFENDAKPSEVHALALLYDGKTGVYQKILLRVAFKDYVYILFAEEQAPSVIEETRRIVTREHGQLLYTKTKTMSGYQAEESVPSFIIHAPDVGAILRDPHIKQLGGFIEEHTSVSKARKLTAICKMSLCGWVSLAGAKIIAEGNPARLAKPGVPEFLFEDWSNLKGMSPEIREAFIPPPTSAIKVLSFDIEVYKPSVRGSGMPDAEDSSNLVMCISVVTSSTSMLSGVEDRNVTLHTIYPIARKEEFLPAGTLVVQYRTEFEMIRGFWDQVVAYDPTLLLGFNIQGWDYRYLHTRMVKVHRFPYPIGLSIYANAPPLRNRISHWSSAAYKHNDMVWPDIPGMVTLDLHKMYVKTHPSLRKHSLDYVSRTFIGRGKYDMSQDRMVRAFEHNDPHLLALVAQYNIEDSMLVLDLYLREHLFEVAAIEAITNQTLIDDLYTKGAQIRAVNVLYPFVKAGGFVFSTTPTLSVARAPGGGGDAKNVVGALVTAGSPGVYEDVAVYDVGSMYPSLILALNICPTTFVVGDPAGVLGDKPYSTYEWESRIGDADDAPREKREAIFVKQSVRRGVCGDMISAQLELRARIKSWAESAAGESSDMKRILNRVQKGVKLVSNSLIGLMAASMETSRLSFPAAAGVVYTRARSLISTVIQDVTSSWNGAPHGPVVYSDTDSIFVAGMTTQEARRLLLEHLNAKYSPFVFSHETTGRLLLTGPKSYILKPTDERENEGLVIKGREFSGRVASEFVTGVIQEIVHMIMNDGVRDRAVLMGAIESHIKQMTKLKPEDFAMSATVSKSDRSVGGKLGMRLRASYGMLLQPGDVVDYVVLRRPYGEDRKVGKKPGVTERTATLEELKRITGSPELINSDANGIDLTYYKDSLLAAAERILVF